MNSASDFKWWVNSVYPHLNSTTALVIALLISGLIMTKTDSKLQVRAAISLSANINLSDFKHHLSSHNLLECPWARQTLLFGSQPLWIHCTPIEAAQTPLQSFNITTSSLLKLSPVYRFSFTEEMSCSLHLDGFHFITVMTLPHQSEKSKPFGQAYYLPPSPPLCHNHGSSNKTVTGSSAGRIIS